MYGILRTYGKLSVRVVPKKHRGTKPSGEQCWNGEKGIHTLVRLRMIEQLSFFEQPQEIPQMSIEEMRKHEWVVAWSGGKDSTATVIKCHEYGVPIKAINFVQMMWDEDTPAILPIMFDFVMQAKSVFEEWGYKMCITKSAVTGKSRALQVFKKSSYPFLVGKTYGARAFLRGRCTFQKYKELALKKLGLDKEYQMIGYASDETERLHRLTKKNQSILWTLDITENECFKICRDYNLLSPLYDLGFDRDGCWFCPNRKLKERDYLRENHPNLYKEILWMLSITDLSNDIACSRNNWIQEYLEKIQQKDQISIEELNEHTKSEENESK